MIDVPNPRNFYNSKEMEARRKYIPEIKTKILSILNDLENKIITEEPLPHGNMDIDFLVEVHDTIDGILNNWYY